MARENGWGAPRIHGELLKLGIGIDERTVSRYLPRGSTSPDRLQRWLAFLHNHRDALVVAFCVEHAFHPTKTGI